MALRQFWNMTAHRGRDSITPPRHQRPMRGASPRAHSHAAVPSSPLTARAARARAQPTRRRLFGGTVCAGAVPAAGSSLDQALDEAMVDAEAPCAPPKPAARAALPVCTTDEPVQGNELVRFKRKPRFEYDDGGATPNPYAVLNVPRNVRARGLPCAWACEIRVGPFET